MQIDGVGAAQPKGVGVAPKSPQQADSKPVNNEDEVCCTRRRNGRRCWCSRRCSSRWRSMARGYKAPKAQDQPEAVTPDTLFDFQSVADNVLQFVTGRLGCPGRRQVGRQPDRHDGAGPQGVDKGFGDARKQLGDWADNSDIKTGMDQSYKLIQEGLDQFEKEFFGKVSTTDMGQAEMASRQQGSLEIQTKDGDKVVLRFNDSWQTKSQKDDSGSQFSLKSSQSFSFSLEGNLSSEEMDSIGKLVKGIDDLAGNFFSGNFDDLLKKAGELKLDDSQLASYSLKLKQSLKLSQTYQGAHSCRRCSPLADYLPKLDQVQQQADTLLPASQQQALTPAVLAARGQSDPAQVGSFTSFNQRMLDALRMIGQFQPATDASSKSV